MHTTISNWQLYSQWTAPTNWSEFNLRMRKMNNSGENNHGKNVLLFHAFSGLFDVELLDFVAFKRKKYEATWIPKLICLWNIYLLVAFERMKFVYGANGEQRNGCDVVHMKALWSASNMHSCVDDFTRIWLLNRNKMKIS